jgi:hypothetical protein
MSTNDPQFLYMMLILPSLFGLTLVGEGIYKIIHDEWNGLVSVIFGILFLAMVVFAYYFFSTNLLK